jgi:hypothetical protein
VTRPIEEAGGDPAGGDRARAGVGRRSPAWARVVTRSSGVEAVGRRQRKSPGMEEVVGRGGGVRGRDSRPSPGGILRAGGRRWTRWAAAA